MRIIVGVVGKLRDAGLAAAIHEYETRAARYWPLEVYEVREESARATSPDLVREREGERLLAKVPRGAQLVSCDLDGERFTSEEFATFLQQARERERDLVFAVGGAFGLGPSLRARAAIRLSLAPWTLPHDLARLVLAEQLYRAGTIVRREPYHK
jgi:23S rRNA (pseudouridine1915-N3)-methyltransferase